MKGWSEAVPIVSSSSFWVKKFAKTSFQLSFELLVAIPSLMEGGRGKRQKRDFWKFLLCFSRVSPRNGWDSFWQTLLQLGGAYLWAILGFLCDPRRKVGSFKAWLMLSISNTYSQIRCPYRSQGCLAQLYMSTLGQMNLTQYAYAADCQETR